MLVASGAFAGEFDITEENLRSASLVSGSESRQKIGLYSIHHGLTTASFMALMDQSRTKILAEIPIRPAYGIAQPASEWLDIVWNEPGTAVAIQDSLDRDSRVLIYSRRPDSTFRAVDLPDLKIIQAAAIPLKAADIKSSGQKPLQWASDRLLTIRFQYLTTKGKRYQLERGIAIDERGNYLPQ